MNQICHHEPYHLPGNIVDSHHRIQGFWFGSFRYYEVTTVPARCRGRNQEFFSRDDMCTRNQYESTGQILHTAPFDATPSIHHNGTDPRRLSRTSPIVKQQSETAAGASPGSSIHQYETST